MNSDLLSSFGRMFPDSFLPTEEKISTGSLPSLTGSGILEHGELLMLNTSEWPSVEEGSSAVSLAQILEPHVARKYYLSARACQGILRRAERRGKELPAQLRAALEAWATPTHQTETEEG